MHMGKIFSFKKIYRALHRYGCNMTTAFFEDVILLLFFKKINVFVAY